MRKTRTIVAGLAVAAFMIGCAPPADPGVQPDPVPAPGDTLPADTLPPPTPLALAFVGS